MKTFKEVLDGLRARAKGLIKPESSKEEIADANSLLADIDQLEKDYNDKVTENGKFKDVIVNMVANQGNGETPPDDSKGEQPKSMDEFLADFEAENNK